MNDLKEVAWGYDQLGDDWYFEAQFTRFEKIGKVLHKYYNGGKFLDVGGLSGRIGRHYISSAGIPMSSYYISDFAPGKLADAEKVGFNTIFWEIGKADPLPEYFFDLCLCAEVIEHIFDTESLLHSLHKTLKTGGHLFLTTPNLVQWRNRFRMLFGKSPFHGNAPSIHTHLDPFLSYEHIRICVLEEWIHLLRTCGFRIVETVGLYSRTAHDTHFLGRVSRLIDRFFERFPSMSVHVGIIAQKTGNP
ncbi:MAG: methyltransferase domain-containing protein [Candidatus Riflebacteria bacterium]|nr:methyltransferase domain-containing protein [Candidatus Riflebacteria bacterium]